MRCIFCISGKGTLKIGIIVEGAMRQNRRRAAGHVFRQAWLCDRLCLKPLPAYSFVFPSAPDCRMDTAGCWIEHGFADAAGVGGFLHSV